jgi:chemotaxis protein MotA
MDWTSLIGLALALGGIFVGQTLEGTKLGLLLQPAAFLIVVVGTFGAVLLQSRRACVLRGLGMLRWVFFPPRDRRRQLASDISAWGMTARREGLLSLEQFADNSNDPFVTKGLRLVVDGINPLKMREIFDIDISAFESDERQAIKIWESAGGYSPTIGILGAVLGLIHVMENLSNPSALGGGIAVAFVSTIYGVGLANLFFLPIAGKLKAIVGRQVTEREILSAVFIDISGGDNARVIEERIATLMR